MFKMASKIGELLGRYQEYPAKSMGKQGEGIHDSGASKKLAGFFIRNLVKLVNPIPGGRKRTSGGGGKRKGKKMWKRERTKMLKETAEVNHLCLDVDYPS
jgi:hypothetical protein